MALPSPRLVNLAIALVCLGLLGTAFYMEHVMGLEPCPLCMMQRIAVASVGLAALLAFVVNAQAWGRYVLAGLVALFATAGMGLSGRQLWLQSLPADQVPACGPGLDYMLEVFPLLEVISIAIRGTGDCAEVQWTFLGLSIPGWTILAFAAMFMAALYTVFYRKSTSDRNWSYKN